MAFRMGIGAITLLALTMAAQAAAGTLFRLEVGLPIAAGTDFKVKDVKKAVMAIRAMVCDDMAGVQITATVEGIVNGVRQSVPLSVIATQTPGVYAIGQQWPDEGQWVVHLAGTCPAPKAAASTIVPVSKAGFNRDKTQVLREPATPRQIEAALKAVTAPGSGS